MKTVAAIAVAAIVASLGYMALAETAIVESRAALTTAQGIHDTEDAATPAGFTASENAERTGSA